MKQINIKGMLTMIKDESDDSYIPVLKPVLEALLIENKMMRKKNSQLATKIARLRQQKEPVIRCKRPDDVILESFDCEKILNHTVGFQCVPCISVFAHPEDYPDKYVARLFYISRQEPDITKYIVVADHLQELRSKLKYVINSLGLVRFARSKGNNKVLVETWM